MRDAGCNFFIGALLASNAVMLGEERWDKIDDCTKTSKLIILSIVSVPRQSVPALKPHA